MGRQALTPWLALLAAGLVACAPPEGRLGPRQAHGRIDDSLITARIEARLAQHDAVVAPHITVNTRHGLVTLSGLVPPAQIVLSEEIAQSVRGVRAVRNELRPAVLT